MEGVADFQAVILAMENKENFRLLLYIQLVF